jgi:hypothetical protein
MNDLESLAVDFIQLPPRALPEDWIAVTVDDVAEMLRQARVREPWHALSSAAIRLPSASTFRLATDPYTMLERRSQRSPYGVIPV